MHQPLNESQTLLNTTSDAPEPSKSTQTEMMIESPTLTTETASDSKSLIKPEKLAERTLKNKAKASLDRFEDAIGGRENLIDTLALSNLDKKQEHFLRLLCDPNRQRDSLVTIARDCGLQPVAVLDLFRHASFAKANALAMGKLTEALPAVAADIAEKSVDSKVECPTCFGDMYIKEGIECPSCFGRGKVMRTSDLDRQKILMEVTGVLKKGPGVAVNVQQNNIQAPQANMFSSYVKKTDDAAYDVSDIVDAETVKEPDGK